MSSAITDDKNHLSTSGRSILKMNHFNAYVSQKEFEKFKPLFSNHSDIPFMRMEVNMQSLFFITCCYSGY